MNIERTNLRWLVVNRLPDGSKVIVDSVNSTVFALNPMAGAAWDACSRPTNLLSVTAEMRRSFHPETTEELARQAVFELAGESLVRASGASAQVTRRRMLGSLGAALALPLVVSLTMADQRAFAQNSGSLFNRPRANPLPPRLPRHNWWW
jgi:hypothetical protein